MKRLFTGAMVAALLSSLTWAAAGSAGTSSDPLVSKSYVEDTYLSQVIAEAEENIDSRFQKILEEAAEELNGQIDIPEGYIIARDYDSLSLQEDGSVTLASGSSIIVISGTVRLHGLEGTVIDISTGRECSEGDVLKRNTRYFCAEDTSALFQASSAAVVAVNGCYLPGNGTSENDSPYSDVDPEDWYYAAVLYTYENNIMSGVGGDEFSPNTNLDRAQIAQVLYNMEGTPSVGDDSGFSDVDSGDWYFDAVTWAAENGIMDGYEGSTFGPVDDVTREQVAVVLYRYAQAKGYDTSAKGDLSAFPDGSKVASWSRDAMSWATGIGLMLGDDSNNLVPQGTATRAQVAIMITRFCQNIA